MKKLILPILSIFIVTLFFNTLALSPVVAFLGFSEGSNELDCQKLWESFSDVDGLTIGGPRTADRGVSDWRFSSKKKSLGKVSGDSCDIGGIRHDTDSEGEDLNGFEIDISYFPNQEEAKSKLSSLKAAESEKIEDKNVSGDAYSMRTLQLQDVHLRPHFLAPGNFGRTVGRIGNCVVSLTHTWYGMAEQWNTGDEYEKQVGLMDIIMEGSKIGWQKLNEVKDLQRFCDGKAGGSQEKVSQQQQPKSDQTGQQPAQSKSNQDGNPFNIFGINPYQTWLNLVELANARAFMATGGLDRFTESTLLHAAGSEPYWERDAKAKEAYDLFYNQAIERLSKLQGKTGLTEISDSTKKTMIEAVKDSVTIKKDAATINLQPINGQKSVLEDNGDWPMLKYGAVDVIVEPQDGKQFEMQTPNTEILVIGTEFSVIYDQKSNESLIAVYKGKVEVKTNDGKITTITPNGDKPGVVVVAQKLSVVKLALFGLVLVLAIGGAILILKRSIFSKKGSKKRK